MGKLAWAMRLASVLSLFAASQLAAKADISPQTSEHIKREIAEISSRIGKLRGPAEQEFWSEKAIDIHGSGWIYSKGDILTFEGQPDPRRVILFEETPRQIIVFNENTVLETWVSTTYYEVPDPQEEARKLGTLLMDPTSMKAAQEAMIHRPTFGPGEAEAPNPYRLRRTRLWLREMGTWKVGFSSGTRIGPRVHPGYGSDNVLMETRP